MPIGTKPGSTCLAEPDEPVHPTDSTAEEGLPRSGRLANAKTWSIRWDYLAFFTVMHALALLVLIPWFFSWIGFLAFFLGVVIFGQLGIPICYHRLLTHRSFQTPRWFERTLVTLALCSAQETPTRWVAWHRLHHARSDQQEDPHSPRLDGLLWAHISWLVHENRSPAETLSMYQKYAKDILSDPYYRWIEKFPFSAGAFYLVHVLIYIAVATCACLLIVGNNAEAYQLLASILVWGIAARTVWVWHITWSVNSLSHVFGYRNYDTKDDSRNNWFVTLITSGEGWHNNHHADPASAAAGHKWWEMDINYRIIQCFGLIGLANNIVAPRCHRKPNQ